MASGFLLEQGPSILRRSVSGPPEERRREVALARESARQRDGGNGNGAVAQHPLGRLDAPGPNVAQRCLSEGLPERPAEMEGAQRRDAGEIRQVDWIADTLLDVLDEAALPLRRQAAASPVPGPADELVDHGNAQGRGKAFDQQGAGRVFTIRKPFHCGCDAADDRVRQTEVS